MHLFLLNGQIEKSFQIDQFFLKSIQIENGAQRTQKCSVFDNIHTS